MVEIMVEKKLKIKSNYRENIKLELYTNNTH